jgi:hypothetical protein
MQEFTHQRELLRPGVTRFATSYLTLQSIHRQKVNLRKMFTSEKWCDSRWAREAKGKKVTEIVLMPSFWNSIVYILKVTGPLVKVLRLVDSEKRPVMGYIYEAMDRCKEAIMKAFNNNESKYSDIFEIIDRRWSCQLHRPLHAAGYYLNPELCYANPDIESDAEVMQGLYHVIQRLVPDPDIQDKITNEMSLYREAKGLFGMDMAIRQRTRKAPGNNGYFVLFRLFMYLLLFLF